MPQKTESENFCISDPLAKTVLDSISAHIAILDQNGVILETNKAWQEYAEAGNAKEEIDFAGINFNMDFPSAGGISA